MRTRVSPNDDAWGDLLVVQEYSVSSLTTKVKL